MAGRLARSQHKTEDGQRVEVQKSLPPTHDKQLFCFFAATKLYYGQGKQCTAVAQLKLEYILMKKTYGTKSLDDDDDDADDDGCKVDRR